MIGQTYRDFFARTIGERHVFMQGGRRSGKTWATIEWLKVLGGVQGGVKVIVMCYQLPQLRATMEDFEMVTGVRPIGSQIDGYTATTKGVKWQFIHLDDRSKAQGIYGDYLFVNEAVNFPSDKGILDTIAPGIKEQIYYNYNPTKSWKYGTDRFNGNNMLQTTWQDNREHLTAEQIAEFEAMKERAMRPNASNFDRYQYEVYYKGNFANMVGAVFNEIGRCTLTEYNEIQSQECFGIDFGFATSGDPTTMMGVKIHDHRIYIRQYIYEQGLTSDEDLARRIYGFGLNAYTVISGDYGGMGRTRMCNLRTADSGKWTGEIAGGVNIVDAIKGNSIMDSLGAMLSMDGIVICEGSNEARAEFEQYELDQNGRPKGADHAIDAARYAFAYAKRVCY